MSDDRDALRLALRENATHGQRRTNADKRKAVETALMDEEWGAKSDREIAGLCAVSHMTVNRVREELGAAGRLSQSDKPILGKDGRSTDGYRKPKPAAPPEQRPAPESHLPSAEGATGLLNGHTRRLAAELAEESGGVLRIGDASLSCGVLDDKERTRVLSGRGLVRALGVSRGGGRKAGGGDELARFIGGDRLSPYLDSVFAVATNPIRYRPKHGGRLAHGYPAGVLVDLCLRSRPPAR